MQPRCLGNGSACTVPPILVFLNLRRQRARNDAPRLPPGPWRLPVTGSLHHLLLTKNPRLVHRTLADLARRRGAAPVMYLRLGELPVMVVSSPGAGEEVLRTRNAAFAARPVSPSVKAVISDMLGLLLSPYGGRWRRLRKIYVAELLCARRVLSLRPVREAEAARLAAAAAASQQGEQPVNVSKCIADYVADVTLRAIIGERRDEFVEAVGSLTKRTALFRAGDLFPSLKRLFSAVNGGAPARILVAIKEKMLEMTDRVIDRHRERKAAADAGVHRGDNECLMDALVRIQKQEGDFDGSTVLFRCR